MAKEDVLTTFQAAEHCMVTPNTVKNWAKTKGLKTFRTAGGHIRIFKKDLDVFMEECNIPYKTGERIIKKKLMIVDDDRTIRDSLSKFLNLKCNYLEITTAEDGFEAGIKLTQFNPDIIILDLMMPNLNGFSVLEKIKSNPLINNIKIIVLTGFGDEANVQRAYNSGADRVLKKPVHNEVLLNEINKSLLRGSSKKGELL